MKALLLDLFELESLQSLASHLDVLIALGYRGFEPLAFWLELDACRELLEETSELLLLLGREEELLKLALEYTEVVDVQVVAA